MNKVLKRARLLFILLNIFLYSSVNSIYANEDLTKSQEVKVLKFGMSTALSGPAADLGKNVLDGIMAEFNEFNDKSQSQGDVMDHYRIELIALDDGYEPSRTAPNMDKLIDEENVLAVIGNVGTPTAVVSVPKANESKTLLFGAYTGAGILRKNPPDRYVINYRASYAQETAAMVDGLINEAGYAIENFAFFTQRDSYGDAGFDGGIAALKRHGLEDITTIPHGRYERNTIAIEEGLAELLESENDIKAIIMVGAYKPCSEFIKLAKESGFEDALFLNVSFVGTAPLMKALGDQTENVIITQVVPPLSSELDGVKRFVEDFKAAYPDRSPNLGAFEGFLVADILLQAIKKIDGEITRESIIDSLESLESIDVGLGSSLSLSKTDHQASDDVWPTKLVDGQILEYKWMEAKK